MRSLGPARRSGFYPERFCFGLLLLAWFSLTAPGSLIKAEAAEVKGFVYHRFGEVRYPSTNIDVDIFSAQLRLLRDQDYMVLPLGEVVRRMLAAQVLPERCAVLTIDDGYSSFWSGAWPLLKKFGYPATLFVSTDSVGAPGYLTWDELRQLSQQGIEIGNHSASHAYLLNRATGESETQWQQRVANDIVRAQQAFEKELSLRPVVFAYPFGEFSPQLTTIVRQLGFDAAVGQQSGVITSTLDRFTLPRFPMGGAYGTLDEFRRKLAMRALPVHVVAPATPLLGAENPPELIVDIDAGEADLTRLQLFVSGQPGEGITPDALVQGRFRIRATGALQGRRNKYTLTAPGGGGEWYWFSQPWFRATGP